LAITGVDELTATVAWNGADELCGVYVGCIALSIVEVSILIV
jgi:hypothetical protein